MTFPLIEEPGRVASRYTVAVGEAPAKARACDADASEETKSVEMIVSSDVDGQAYIMAPRFLISVCFASPTKIIATPVISNLDESGKDDTSAYRPTYVLDCPSRALLGLVCSVLDLDNHL